MFKLIAIVAALGACSFVGSLVGSQYLHSSPAQAAAPKKGPSAAVLAARIASLQRGLGRLVNRVVNIDNRSFRTQQTASGLDIEINGTFGLKNDVRSICSALKAHESYTLICMTS
jgi:hypothetical protein